MTLLIYLTSRPAFCWGQHPHCAGIYAVDLLTSLSSLRCPHCCARVLALIAPMLPPALRRHLCWHSAGVVALLTLASTPLFCWHCCRCCVATIVALALSPALCGVLAIIVQALLGWHLCRCFSGIVPLVMLVFAQSKCRLRHHHHTWRHHHAC
jgi:hypothetical protein